MFSLSAGIIHPYHAVAMAPATGAARDGSDDGDGADGGSASTARAAWATEHCELVDPVGVAGLYDCAPGSASDSGPG